MGNQTSTPQKPLGGGSGGNASHSHLRSLRQQPQARRCQPALSARDEPDVTDDYLTPEQADSPKTPDPVPLSPTSTVTPSLPFGAHRLIQRGKAVDASQVGVERVGLRMGNSQSNEQWRDRESRRRERDAHTSPVQVPVGHSSRHGRSSSVPYESDMVIPTESDYTLRSNLNFPPRLPLPIQEEVYTPGSPIITPDELSQALREDSEGILPHRTSLLSHTTADDEEDTGDIDLEPHKGRTVPTIIRWKGHAEKVYITGSFAGWARKFRMHRDPHDSQSMITKLDLLPGTHHVKFIVDGDMQLSDALPTAVDYTNILVNYIEVSADDIPHEKPVEQPPSGVHPPLVVPPGVEQHDFAPQSSDENKDQTDTEKKYIGTRNVHYSDDIPQYLPDLDRDESSNRFRRSANHINDIPTPPSLPLFLGKSILNGTTPMKDDSSVLNMPNHTVLNHLATSSIKNDVLATSLTTRYGRKYVTTITYRPTKEDD